MAASNRGAHEKGRKGEAEVAGMYRAHGFEVRGLEQSGDHLVVCGPASGVLLHVESKRQENARPWAWWEQASSNAPATALVVVNFRRNRSPWMALMLGDELATLLERIEHTQAALEVTRGRLDAVQAELARAEDDRR